MMNRVTCELCRWQIVFEGDANTIIPAQHVSPLTLGVQHLRGSSHNLTQSYDQLRRLLHIQTFTDAPRSGDIEDQPKEREASYCVACDRWEMRTEQEVEAHLQMHELEDKAEELNHEADELKRKP